MATTRERRRWQNWGRPWFGAGHRPGSIRERSFGRTRWLPVSRSRIPRTVDPCESLLKSWFRPALTKESHSKKARIVTDESKPKPVTYADAGVDIPSGDRAKERIKF